MKKQTVHGERIEEIRKDRKLSQRELAAQAGISYDALRRVENGETNTINSDMLIRLAEFFEVSTDYILGLSNIRERRSYAVSQLGLSEESVKRLVSRKIDPDSLNLFLGNDRFVAITQLAKTYLLQRTLDGMLGMNAIMDYAIEGMKNASVTDPEAKRERVRHIAALQGVKSQGSNAGRDQMEHLFSQMLTEMEKTMDVRSNRQTTANDEMVLGMMK
ncbi:MAG: helix-turn-helix transcriptional regulator, partial [Clostridia bacterium]|nr:helix-turn-helix transcriptional regulator [Clostridia bacterium]